MPGSSALRTPQSQGFFIAFEGIDGCGKSTAARAVAERIRASGRLVLLTKEPTGSSIGRKIRRILAGGTPVVEPMELQRLFVEDRRDHIERIILPALRAGTIVVSDRYWLSTVAYGMLNKPREKLIALHEKILGKGFLRPDRTLLLDLEPTTALERMQGSRRTLTHFEKLEKLSRIRENYRSLVRANGDVVTVVDARMPAEAVAEVVWRIIEPLLPPSAPKTARPESTNV